MKYLLLALFLFIPSSVYAFTYENTDLNIRMEIPDDWVYREFRTNNIVSSYVYSVEFAPNSLVNLNERSKSINSSVIMTVLEDNFAPYENMPLDLYLDYFINEYDYKRTDFQNTSIGKDNVFGYVSEYVDTDKNYKYLAISITNHEPLWITFITDGSNFDKYYPMFQNITKSIEFLN